jgi:ATP-dependent exoDNAse (exonuclease V) beta subunit
VNERFDEVFKEPGLDPTPRALEAHRDEVNREGARTLALPVPQLPEDGDRRVPTLTPLIATTVAAFLDDITNRRPVDIWDGKCLRPARPGDVAILVRRMSPEFIGHYERALTAQGVPYRLVGGKEYFARDEVRALAKSSGRWTTPRTAWPSSPPSARRSSASPTTTSGSSWPRAAASTTRPRFQKRPEVSRS